MAVKISRHISFGTSITISNVANLSLISCVSVLGIETAPSIILCSGSFNTAILRFFIKMNFSEPEETLYFPHRGRAIRPDQEQCFCLAVSAALLGFLRSIIIQIVSSLILYLILAVTVKVLFHRRIQNIHNFPVAARLVFSFSVCWKVCAVSLTSCRSALLPHKSDTVYIIHQCLPYNLQKPSFIVTDSTL